MSYNLARTHGMDARYWYYPDTIMSENVQKLFFQLHPDDITQGFLDKSSELSSNYFWQTIRNVGVMLLSTIYSKTDINGIIGFGNMFLFSENQMATFLDINRNSWSSIGKNVLDLGAGNGDITEHLRPFFQNVYATELSSKMRSRLQSKGYTLLDAVQWSDTDVKFDLITAFNLLDRHYSPRKLLKDLWTVAHKSNCNVVLSLVLPISYYVEFNPNETGTRPDRFLDIRGRSYADHVDDLIHNEFQPANFEVVKWTRLPYLCEGDMNHAAYYLPDAVFLLKPVMNQNADSESKSQEIPSETTATVHTEL